MRNLNFIFAVLILAGCASKPPKTATNLNQWEAKAQIKDLRKNSSKVVSLDIISEWPGKLRAEVTATLGYQVASIALNKSEVQYIIYPQKKFVEGTLTQNSLKELFNVDFNPRMLINFSFDKPIRGKNWTCELDSAQLPTICRRSTDNLLVQWKDRSGDRKKVIVQNADFEVQIAYKSFQTNIHAPSDPFVLESPEGFRKYKIP